VKVTETRLHGVRLFVPTPFRDDRGWFSRTFDAATFAECGLDPATFRQDSLSRSRRGVIRGLHLRSGQGEAKLVRCSAGRIFDVVVDLRPGSATFGEWMSFLLDGEEQVSVYIPAGCAHGFQALTEPADTAYRIDRDHNPDEDVTIAYNDPSLKVPWPLELTQISQRDAHAPTLKSLGLVA
jgi:dTDP-4-dehydrorhamnose 3,5-epimerase